MKRLLPFFILTICVWCMACMVNAADMVWDYDADHDNSVGYTVYYTDTVNNYNKTFLVSEMTSDGVSVRIVDIETNLNLAYNVEYTFYLTRYNSAGESGASNSVVFTRTGYTPPADVLPGSPAQGTSGTTNLIIE